MKKAKEIRSEFLSYFKSQGHTVVESAGLVPHNDPTLLFTSAGMVQFKDCFLGEDVRPYKRATTAQKCLRAGGKHNDLENVGFTARHHTFFEMLGNFSFGDYFKKDSIHFGWEFVTKYLQIPKDRIYVTVFETDDEAADIWHKQEGVPQDRIYRFGEKDNFWSAGDVGPCGPCSEIFVDRGVKYAKGPGDVMGGDGDRYMEIWNHVFMQYNRDASGKLNPLKRPSIDTGAGLERIASVLQDVETNYEIDLFSGIISNIRELAKTKKTDPATTASLRVIADHLRATNFLMADGVLPSNEGRGYVLRRIMRRAIRHGRNLGFREPFFWRLTDTLIGEMGDAYPELKDKKAYIEENVRQEEERFLQTLDNGLKLLDEAIGKAHGKVIPGDVAFKLYDSFGFPLDLTEVIATERGFSVDQKGYEKNMEEQRTRSRESWKGSGEEAVGEIFKQLKTRGFKTEFLGYKDLDAKGHVLALIENGKEVKKSTGGKLHLIVDRTPFYAESGGQAGDLGTVKGPGGFEAPVVDVRKPTGDYVVLHLENAKGSISAGDALEQQVSKRQRALTAKNHTATHLLHAALQRRLGAHVKQAGSLVNADLLRFDFSHGKAMTAEEIEAVENEINEKILEAMTVTAEEMPKDQALAKGAMAFFGDKYGDRVRVLTVGDYSIELCGGTHVNNSADIMAFKILSENGIAAGVRRITAVTGPKVVELARKRDQEVRAIMARLGASAPEEIITRIDKLEASEKEARKALEAQGRKAASGVADDWIKGAATLGGGVKFVRGVLPTDKDSTDVSTQLRDLAENLRSKLTGAVVAIGAFDHGKQQAMIVVGVTKDLIAKVKAGDIIKHVAPLIEGKGGGKPELAQAGGKHPEKFPEVFKAIEGLLN